MLLTKAAGQTARHCSLVLLFYALLFTIFFAPVIFNHGLLAPGDGLLYHISFFQSKKVFWDTLLANGFPMTADPQVMAWYPPSMLLSLLPGGWNLFVLSAYLMASCFTYGYVYALTKSGLAGLAGGTIYGMCGFMMAHLGHTTIIHVAAWLPLIVWSLEMLRRKFSAVWLAVGSFAVACCVLAGHLQIAVYVLLLSACYILALGWRAETGRWRYYLISFTVLFIGLGLAGLQILPTAELANLSARTGYTFSDFASYSFPLNQSVLLIFPGVFGGLSYYGVPSYFGQWNLTEVTGYVGLLPLMLAGAGFVATRRRAVSIFWLSAALVALLLALGDQTPLAQLIYRLPVIGKFRVPSRHFVEMAFSVSVLAGIGVEAITRRAATTRLLLKTVLVGAGLMIAGLLFLISQHAAPYAFPGGVVRLNALPWSNTTVAVPFAIFLAAALALLYWQRNPASVQRKILFVGVLVLDLSSFGWFYSWQEYSPPASVLTPQPFVANYQRLLRASNQRAIPTRGVLGTPSEIPPNLSRLWGIPSASGYSPLSLSRVTQLLSMRADASLDASWMDQNDQSLNLAAVRYLFLPRAKAVRDERGLLWDTEDMDIWLGSGCDHPERGSVRFDLPTPVRATTVGVVNRLACSTSVADGEEVARVSVRDSAGVVQTTSILAGRDTSEWAYDCRTVTRQMKHARAQVFSSFPAKMYDEPCEGHYYLATLNLGGIKEVSSLELQWTGRAGALTVEKISLIDEGANSSTPINPLSKDSSRWRFTADAGEATVYENLRALPRAWLVPEVVALRPEEILAAIKTSRLPDGRAYDPARTALVEEASAVMAEQMDASATAQMMHLSETALEVRTTSASPSFLVTSDADYPGWRATVDGEPVQIFRTDYALRGVRVPAGSHLVRFDFRPKSFYYGAAISAFSLLVLAGLLLLPALRRKSA